jgi:hypothetical protein
MLWIKKRHRRTERRALASWPLCKGCTRIFLSVHGSEPTTFLFRGNYTVTNFTDALQLSFGAKQNINASAIQHLATRTVSCVGSSSGEVYAIQISVAHPLHTYIRTSTTSDTKWKMDIRLLVLNWVSGIFSVEVKTDGMWGNLSLL